MSDHCGCVSQLQQTFCPSASPSTTPPPVQPPDAPPPWDAQAQAFFTMGILLFFALVIFLVMISSILHEQQWEQVDQVLQDLTPVDEMARWGRERRRMVGAKRVISRWLDKRRNQGVFVHESLRQRLRRRRRRHIAKCQMITELDAPPPSRQALLKRRATCAPLEPPHIVVSDAEGGDPTPPPARPRRRMSLSPSAMSGASLLMFNFAVHREEPADDTDDDERSADDSRSVKSVGAASCNSLVVPLESYGSAARSPPPLQPRNAQQTVSFRTLQSGGGGTRCCRYGAGLFKRL